MTKYHYVYRITNIVEHKHYYGVRSSKVHPSQDLGIKYFSSSTDKEFLLEQKLNKENFKYKVIKTFETRTEANLLESKLHNMFEVHKNKNFYNKYSSNSKTFDTSDYVKCKDVNGNEVGLIHVQSEDFMNGIFTAFSKNRVTLKNDDESVVITVDKNSEEYEKYKNAGFSGFNKGYRVINFDKKFIRVKTEVVSDYVGFVSAMSNKTVVKDKNGNRMVVSIDDERYKSGELVNINFQMATVKDKNSNVFYVSTNDERYLSGELVSVNKGKVVCKDIDGKNASLTKEEFERLNYKGVNSGKVSVKDKNGSTMMVSVTDKRYINGELIHVSRGLITVKDSLGNTFKVNKDDERYLSGELVGCTKDMILVKDSTGKNFMVSKHDARYKSGELVGINKGKVFAMTKDNVRILVFPDDERFLSGELIRKFKK